MSPLYISNGKIVVRDGKLAQAEACCCDVDCDCSSLDLNILLYGDEPYSWPLVELGRQETPMYDTGDPPPQTPGGPGSGIGSCKRKPACLRWVCIKFGDDGEVLSSSVYGGPTANDLNLVDLAIEKEGTEAGGCWVYTFEFFAWTCYSGGYLDNGRPDRWAATLIPSDTAYSIYKTQMGGG